MTHEHEPKPLNRLEVWVSEHAAPIFVVVAALIVLGAGAVFFTFQKSDAAQDQINLLRPQVTKVVRAASACNSATLDTPKGSRDCANRLRIALINCRQRPRCRAAFIAVLTYPPPARISPKGGGAQNPSSAGQPTKPGKGSAPGKKSPPKTKQPAASQPPPLPPQSPPAPAAAPVAPVPAPPPEPGRSADTPAPDRGAKVCVDLVVSACVKAP